MHYAFSNISACTIQIGIRHFYFNHLQQHQLCSSTSKYAIRLSLNLYIFLHIPLIHHIHLFAFWTDGLWYRGEGRLFGTLHPTRSGPNIFYVGEEEEPGWGQCSTNPRRGERPRSLTRHSLEILALRIETVGTC